jgi:hypothetical protein
MSTGRKSAIVSHCRYHDQPDSEAKKRKHAIPCKSHIPRVASYAKLDRKIRAHSRIDTFTATMRRSYRLCSVRHSGRTAHIGDEFVCK